jgi:N-acetylglucosamine kinase-like BadF-type ATPase
MTFIVGVDGGNTKTLALVATTNGTIVGKGRRGCGDIYGVSSPEIALHEIESAVDDAVLDAGLSRNDIKTACFSLAGADWDDDNAYLQTELESRGLARQVIVYNDSIGALRAGTTDGIGVIIACGTGAAIAARNAEGKFWHSSFWQEPMGGSTLGDETLHALIRAELGLEPPTTLTKRVLELFDQPTVEALLQHFYQRGSRAPTRVTMSKIAPLVLQEAEVGDRVAKVIVSKHGTLLGEYAIVATQKVGLHQTSFPVVLNGGIFRHSGTQLIQAITHQMAKTFPDIRPIRSRYEPVIGALLLAIESCDIPITDTHLNQIDFSLPSDEFFST